mgnify:CR=1 FL=1
MRTRLWWKVKGDATDERTNGWVVSGQLTAVLFARRVRPAGASGGDGGATATKDGAGS